MIPLPIALGYTLQLILLLDSITVRASFCSVDQLFSQALGNAFDVPERGFTGTNCEESDSLVDAAEGRYIDGLSSYGTSRSNTGAVLAWAAVNNSVDGDLDGILVCHDVDLKFDAVSLKFLLPTPIHSPKF